jgi:hypothetical protein
MASHESRPTGHSRRRQDAMRVTQVDMWTYREPSQLGTELTREFDLTGYGVEAIDGSIGKIDEATYEVGASHVIVDTGPWIFGRKVLLPAGVVQRVDEAEEKVFVNRTKDQVKDAPEYDDSLRDDERYRNELGSYYGEGGPGYRDFDDVR